MITDPKFLTCRNEIESKGVQYLLIKSVGAASRQSPAIARKFVALYHRKTKIRMRSDERDYLQRPSAIWSAFV